METMSHTFYTRPACGYNGLEEPPWLGREPSDEVCPSCGIHFGYDDTAAGGDAIVRAATYPKWRERWKSQRMRWFSSAKKGVSRLESDRATEAAYVSSSGRWPVRSWIGAEHAERVSHCHFRRLT
jgi:hypothetical protein